MDLLVGRFVSVDKSTNRSNDQFPASALYFSESSFSTSKGRKQIQINIAQLVANSHDESGGVEWHECLGSGLTICMTALSTKPGGRYGTLLLNSIPRQNIIFTSSVLLKFRGESFDIFGKHYEGNAEDFEFAKMFTSLTEQLLAEGKLKPHPVKLGEGGFQGVLEGVKLMRDGKVSGEKFVDRTTDTP
jgi:hypothetical protein